MTKTISLIIIAGAVFAGINSTFSMQTTKSAAQGEVRSAVFAGGCFWCMESDFEKLDGVLEAVSGYTGGLAETATYKQVGHVESAHYEAVQVRYDPQTISYAELVDYYWKQIDPTDADGQFCDKGSSYRSAIFYGSEPERAVIEKSLTTLRQNKRFVDPIVTAIRPAKPFYAAEDYHQDYYKKNPIRYKYYRNGCRRDNRLAELWGD